jgi:DNA-directed RNA polymerase
MNAERYDAPFCLLAAATELHQVFVRLGRYPTMDEIMAGGIGQDFPSSLPVTIDGSCNGLQHLSALGLDPIGAAATNLIPLADPADVYDAVRRVVDSMIERDVAEIMYEDRFPDPNDYPPVAWRGRVTRNTCKRGVMTTPYGVTQQGIFLQLIADGFAKNVPGKATNNARYLKRCIHEAVGTVVVSARAIMDWLQAVSVVLSDDDRAVSWVTPCGVRVTQRYVETRRKTLETVWGSLSLQEPNADWSLSHRDQYRGIAPNVVHSFDAAHLVQTFNLFAQHEPYADVVGTHDAFTTQAGAMETLSRITRESFVSIYSEDWLDKLYQYFQSQTKKEIPKPPARGVLDIRQVLLSEGFFR